MVIFHFFICFRPDIPFLGKFGPKNQNCQFKLKFGTYNNSNKLKFGTQSNLNMQNSVVTFTFPVFDQKYPFWANLTQKFKIVQSEI